MLDQSRSEMSVSQVLSRVISSRENDRGPPFYFQPAHKKRTVKELIRMKRLCSEQKWNRSQEKSTLLAHMIQSLKPDPVYEAAACEPSLYPPSPPTPIDPTFTNHFLPSPENSPVYPEYIQNPALQINVVPAVDGNMSFFHWQIQQEANRFEGVDPEVLNMQDEDGDTFLHIAVAQGRRALAYVLAAKMAIIGSLDMKERNNQTALQIAAATNQHLIVQDLLAHGAQMNTRDSWGRSPLHVCAEKGHLLSLQSIQKTLLGRGPAIDVEMYNYDGLTPLHGAVFSHNAIVRELRSPENACSFMTTELTHRKQMYVQCIRTLMLMGACCGTKDLKSGRTSLHMASEEANMELFQLFLDQPSSLSIVNVKTFNGNTALHIVSSLQNHKAQVQAVRLLMRNGADPSAKNIENELPAQLVPEGAIGEKVRQVLKGKDVRV